jgi:hypothetical protein
MDHVYALRSLPLTSLPAAAAAAATGAGVPLAAELTSRVGVQTHAR